MANSQLPSHPNHLAPNGREKPSEPHTPHPRRPQSPFTPPVPLTLRPVLLLLIFLPIPPLLSIIHITTGHAILRSTTPSFTATSLLTSVNAAATGGAILALPLVLLLYILFFPTKEPAPEDFFEDDDASHGRGRRTWGCIVCGALLLGVGAAAGALGVTCLGGGKQVKLSPAEAAEAGVVGGVVISVAMVVVVLSVLGVWWLTKTRRIADRGGGSSSV